MGEGSPFTPQAIKARYAGPRRSVAPLLALVDTAEAAFPRIADALKDLADAGVELNEATIEIATKIGRQKHAEEAAKRHARPERRSIVYYLRRGDLIKIGTTVNPVARFKTLMPDEILAFEPGGPELEAARHREFSGCRVARKGEYFRQEPRLLAHVASVRGQHGEPDASWPTVATLGTGYRRSKVKVELPEPKTGEVATATEGAKLLGMAKSTVQGWAHRKVITPAGRNEAGRPVYFVEHMRFLIERNRAWMNHEPHRTKEVSPDSS